MLACVCNMFMRVPVCACVCLVWPFLLPHLCTYLSNHLVCKQNKQRARPCSSYPYTAHLICTQLVSPLALPSLHPLPLLRLLLPAFVLYRLPACLCMYVCVCVLTCVCVSVCTCVHGFHDVKARALAVNTLTSRHATRFFIYV